MDSQKQVEDVEENKKAETSQRRHSRVLHNAADVFHKGNLYMKEEGEWRRRWIVLCSTDLLIFEKEGDIMPYVCLIYLFHIFPPPPFLLVYVFFSLFFF